MQMSNIPKHEQEGVLSSFWSMLRELESKAWDENDVILRHQVREYYKQWGRITGQHLIPRFDVIQDEVPKFCRNSNQVPMVADKTGSVRESTSNVMDLREPKFTMETLKEMFPRTPDLKHNARTGNIPIDFFLANEKEIHRVCRENGCRIIYRGPRLGLPGKKTWYRFQSFTRKCHATSALIYPK